MSAPSSSKLTTLSPFDRVHEIGVAQSVIKAGMFHSADLHNSTRLCPPMLHPVARLVIAAIKCCQGTPIARHLDTRQLATELHE